MSSPLDRSFNVVVLQMASRLFPQGYDVSDVAPDSFETLKAHMGKGGRMLVWNGASDYTIYGDPEINWAFRAWHDWCHYHGNFDFTEEGEMGAYLMQCEQVRALYGTNAKTDEYCRIIYAEVVGQGEHFKETGDFPVDQVAFTADYLASKQKQLELA